MKVGGGNESPVFVMWVQCVFGARVGGKGRNIFDQDGALYVATLRFRLFATKQGVDQRVQPVCWWQGGECVDSGYHGAII